MLLFTDQFRYEDIDQDLLKKDLTVDRPIWILSCYTPRSDLPRQLLGGPTREQSFEELRLRHYELDASGLQQEAVREAQALYESAESQIQKVLSDLPSAEQYLISGNNEYPNRVDICEGFSKSSETLTVMGASPARTEFYRQIPSFGQVTAFSQALEAGRPSNPFSRPSQSTFGQASFGSPPGAPTIQGNPFNQPSSSRKSPHNFGQPSSVFAQGSFIIQPSFGAAPDSTPSTTTFGKAVSMDLAPTLPEALSQSANGFSRANDISGPSAARRFNQAHSQAPNGSSISASAIGGVARGMAADSQKDSTGRLVQWKGQQVSYMDDKPCVRRADGRWERVWFPDPPSWQKKVDVPVEHYSSSLEQQYKYVQEHGTFQNGIMPELPPKREWVNWNF